MEHPCVIFSNGKSMQSLGFGTWMINDPEELETAMNTALEVGCRHFDTAFAYENEELIGNILERWLDEGKITREELFITTKLPCHGLTPSKVRHFLGLSLEKLQLTYVDLYLIHTPIGIKYVADDVPFPTTEEGTVDLDMDTDLIAVWKKMEEVVEEGLAQSIGVANCNEEQLQRICDAAQIPPVTVQMEMHAYFQQREMREQCAKLGVVVTAYAPLGSPGRGPFHAAIGLPFTDAYLLQDPTLGEIAEEMKKSPAQVLIKFLLQQNVAVLTKSANPNRIRENFGVSDFTLSPDDMSRLEDLDRGVQGRSFIWDFIPGSQNHPEYPHKELLTY